MNEEIKKDAEEEMNCILELLEGWCLKYDQDYTNAVVLTKNDQITSWGSIGTVSYTHLDVYKRQEQVCDLHNKEQIRSVRFPPEKGPW